MGTKPLIRGIGGLPGSGKSYFALENLYTDLYNGKVVYTNMRSLNAHKIAWSIHRSSGRPRQKILENLRFIDTWDMSKIWEMGLTNCSIYLDEVMVAWLARDWSKMDRGLINWFSQHRKMRVEFTYIAQSINKVDATLRDMTQKYVIMRNTAFWRFSIFRLPQMFLAIHYAEDFKNILKREWVIPIRKYYGFYDSWALFPSRPLDGVIAPAVEGSRPVPPARSAGGIGGGEPPQIYPLPKPSTLNNENLEPSGLQVARIPEAGGLCS